MMAASARPAVRLALGAVFALGGAALVPATRWALARLRASPAPT